jgi:hypothetical protein
VNCIGTWWNLTGMQSMRIVLRSSEFGEDSVLKIDDPCLELQALEPVCFGYLQVELIYVSQIWGKLYWILGTVKIPSIYWPCS